MNTDKPYISLSRSRRKKCDDKERTNRFRVAKEILTNLSDKNLYLLGKDAISNDIGALIQNKTFIEIAEAIRDDIQIELQATSYNFAVHLILVEIIQRNNIL